MAWACSGDTNTQLIENMWRAKLITDQRVKDAFLKVDRAHYAPSSPYEDSPQPIGHSATISAPHMHASACEYLLPYLLTSSTPAVDPSDPQLPSGRRILDIGSGSGYLTHVLATLAAGHSMVVGLEHIRELRDMGEQNMSKSTHGQHLLKSGSVRFRLGDGRKGWVEDGVAEWDVIHVGASAREVHEELLSQLKAPGCMFIPVDDDESGRSQHVWKISKDKDGQVHRQRLFGVRYVPLTSAQVT